MSTNHYSAMVSSCVKINRLGLCLTDYGKYRMIVQAVRSLWKNEQRRTDALAAGESALRGRLLKAHKTNIWVRAEAWMGR